MAFVDTDTTLIPAYLETMPAFVEQWLGRAAPTGYRPAVLAGSSGRRIAGEELSGTLYHYLRLGRDRLRASSGTDQG